MPTTNKISSKVKTFRILGLVYIVLSGFPYLWKLEGILGKLQAPDFVFLILLIFLLTTSEFRSFISNELSQLFNKNNSIFSLNSVVILYGFAVGFSSIFNYNSSVLVETLGAGYLITLYFCLKYIFLKSEITFGKNSLGILGLIMALTGIAGWILFLLGIENSTGVVRDYPYFGQVFRLQGFTPTPAFFINLVGFIFIFVWTSIEKKIGFISRKLLLGILGFSLVLTLSKSILLLFICVSLYGIKKLKINKALKSLIALVSLGAFLFLQTATHFLFVSCSSAAEEKTLLDDTYVSSLPIYQDGDFCILETNYLLYKRSAIIAGTRNFFHGVGLGQHTIFLQKLATEPAYNNKYYGQSGDSHCTYTGIFGELGFLGLCTIILLFVSLFRASANLSPEFWWASLFFALEAINADIMNFRHLWIFIALVAAYTAKNKLS